MSNPIRIPVYISGVKVGEAASIDDVIRIARENGVRRFVVYAAVRGDGDVPVTPQRLAELLASGQVTAITIIRKEIAGVDIPDALDASDIYYEALRAEAEKMLNEYKRILEDVRRRIASAHAEAAVLERVIAALEKLLDEARGGAANTATTDTDDNDEEDDWETEEAPTWEA